LTVADEPFRIQEEGQGTDAERKGPMKSPGDYIRDELAARGWGQDDLARVLGRPTSRVNEMIQGKAPISLEMAVGLAAAIGGSAAEWLQRDSLYRLSLANTEVEDVRVKAGLYELAPVRDMEKRGWIRKTTTAAELEEELKRFFGTTDLSRPPAIPVSTRRTGGAEVDNQELSAAQRAWCFRARAMAADQVVPPYDPAKFEACVRALRPLAAFAPESRKVASVLSEYGIRFVIVEPLPAAKIDGAAFWIGDDPAIAMSVRYDRIDAFWFTLCHELSHVRHRDPLSVDTALVGDEALPSAMKIDFEERADNEAGAMLIPQDKLDSFVRRVAPYFEKDRIVQFAHVIKVHPGIIVGQLQHRGQLGYHANRDLLVKVRKHATSGATVDGWGHSAV
jgi:HTH-type transcriptional regulator / antitoxin HigA